MTQQVDDIPVSALVEAFRRQEREKIEAGNREDAEKRAAKEALTAECGAALDSVLGAFEAEFDRAASGGMVARVATGVAKDWWSSCDHTMLLIVHASKKGDEILFAGRHAKLDTYKRWYMPRNESVNDLNRTEFTIWLAKFLGHFLANRNK